MTENVETAIFEILEQIRNDVPDERAVAERRADFAADIDLVEQVMSEVEMVPFTSTP